MGVDRNYGKEFMSEVAGIIVAYTDELTPAEILGYLYTMSIQIAMGGVEKEKTNERDNPNK